MLSKVYPIIKRLVHSGNTVKYVSLYPNAKKYLEPLGVQPLSESFTLQDRPTITHRRNFYSTEEHAGYHWFSDKNWALEKIEKMGQYLDEYKPDITVESWGIFTNMVSKVLGRKCISITHGCYHPERKYDRLRWWDDETKEIPTNLLEDINYLFTKYGACTISKFEELYTGDYTLIPSIPELDPLKDSNCFNTSYVAPMVWDSQNHLDVNLLNFNSEWPTIFCYTGKLKDGSSTNKNELLHLFLKAFSGEKFNILLAVGKQSEIIIAKEELKQYSPFVANIAVSADISISDAFNMSDMVIHHGGYGSSVAQIVYAKPSLIVPTHSEREYNARMCENLGLGISMPFERANPDDLRKLTYNVLKNEAYLNCAQKYNLLLREREYPTASDMVEKILGMAQD